MKMMSLLEGGPRLPLPEAMFNVRVGLNRLAVSQLAHMQYVHMLAGNDTLVAEDEPETSQLEL